MTELLGTRADGEESAVERGDDQGRRPRATTRPRTLPLRWQHADALLRLRRTTSAASRTSSRRSTRPRTTAAAWAPTIRSPGARTTRAAARSTRPPGTPPRRSPTRTCASTWPARSSGPRAKSDPVYSDCGATVLANYQQTKISAPPNVNEPIGFDQLPDGRDHPDGPSRPGAPARPGGRHVADHREHPGLHPQRGRPVRPGRRPELRPEQVGVPLLLAAHHGGQRPVRRPVPGDHAGRRGADRAAGRAWTRGTTGAATSSSRASSSSTARRRRSTSRRSRRS